MYIETLAEHFMPEVRKKGEDLFTKDVVTIANASETQASAYIRASGSPRVSLTSEDISSSNVQANCTCSAGKKGRLCKHIWATLLKMQAEEADLLACKTNIEKAESQQESSASRAFKQRQDDYKQKLKEKNRARNKKIRQQKKQSDSKVTAKYPEDVEVALAYFAVNGFDLSQPVQLEELNLARKTLARVFHPDKGGSHDEVLVLNQNYDILSVHFDL